MLRIDRVIGNRADPDWHNRLHELEHRGLIIDVVKMDPTDLDRRRLRAFTEGGEEIAVALSRDDKLFDGAILHIGHSKVIVLRAGEQHWLRLSPKTARDALELGYHAGNLHWRVRFDGDDILVALEASIETYTSRIEPMLVEGRVSMPEGGE
jgi:urease accessory protein